MKTKRPQINYTVGIYNTNATLISHRNGDITVNYGAVKWSNGTGTLTRSNIRLSGKLADDAKAVFAGKLMGIGQFLSEIHYLLK